MLKKILFIILAFTVIQCALPDAIDEVQPTVNILNPYENAVVSNNINVNIEADDNEKVKKVKVYFDGEFLGETTKSPFLIPLNVDTLKDGLVHYLQATAEDGDGNTGVSDLRSFIIAKTPDIIDPTVSIVNPQTGQTVEGIVKVVAVAEDERSIQKVAFFVDGDSVSEDFTYPYGYDWDTTPFADSTNHTIHAKAFDSGGNFAISPTITVTVFPSTDATPPTALMTYPLAGQVVFDTVQVTVEASDNKGVALVEFYVDGVLKSTDTASPYQFNWDTDPYADGGNHSVYAKVYDLAGNTTTTTITTVTVSNKNSSDVTPPEILLLYPVSASTVSGIVNIVADATDDQGVAQVEFFIDGVSSHIDDDGSDSWSFNWNTAPKADGRTHTIYLKAYDTSGNTTTTPITTVTVAQTSSGDITPPSVLVLYPVTGSTVSGTINIVADATDDTAVDFVEFYIDGILSETDTDGSDNWSYSWNTAPYADGGSHSVYIKAYDTSGNVGTSAVVVVTVP